MQPLKEESYFVIKPAAKGNNSQSCKDIKEVQIQLTMCIWMEITKEGNSEYHVHFCWDEETKGMTN